MTQYISKDALVAEIENKIKKYTKRGEESDAKCDGYGMYWGGVLSCLNEIRTLCDTLEVKEADLEKELNEYFKGWTDDYDNGGAACHYQYIQVNDCKAIAKHFFELGLKVVQKRE